jgi:transcription elongation factor Elf1
MTSQKLTLVENALDSLEHAISHLNEMPQNPTAGSFKRIILDLSHVAELLFKEKLRQIHPAFIYADVDKYPSPAAFTVSAANALSRLQRIGNVHFDDADESALKIIREKRNEIEHYAFSIDVAEAKVLIGSVLVFIFRFASDEVNLDWAARRIEDPAWTELNKYAEFFEIEKERVIDELRAGYISTLECPMCNNETFDMEAEVCVLCGYKDGLVKCKHCQSNYLILTVKNSEAGLCPKCEYWDGYAMANFENY